eukprot:3835176-Prorocentrum_lima.AAC.1
MARERPDRRLIPRPGRKEEALSLFRRPRLAGLSTEGNSLIDIILPQTPRFLLQRVVGRP